MICPQHLFDTVLCNLKCFLGKKFERLIADSALNVIFLDYTNIPVTENTTSLLHGSALNKSFQKILADKNHFSETTSEGI